MPKSTITIPCEVGDTIYCVVRVCKNVFESIQTTVCEMSIICNNRIIIGTRNARNKKIIYYPDSAFGETIFFNEKDADNKCEELSWMCENNKCEYSELGYCTFYRSLEEQYDDEQDGLPMDWCDGSEEYQKECGMLEE